MQLIENIKQYKSVSIVGMAKNTGKTTCLNYILRKLNEQNYNVAVTSIGVDGEERDILYDTIKPRITLYNGNIFTTSEKHFNEKQINAKTLKISSQQTALGRLITAKALNTGQVILSGPSDTKSIANFILECQNMNCQLTLIDGALNRMSLANPTVTDAMVLCTGAACANKLEQLVKKVKFQCDVINLPQIDNSSIWLNLQAQKININNEKQINIKSINDIEDGVWGIEKSDNSLVWLAKSLLGEDIDVNKWIKNYKTIYIAGALTDNFLKEVAANTDMAGFKIVISDFSHFFATNAAFYKFKRRGGSIKVCNSAKLIALCVNPTSPEGYHFQPHMLQKTMQNELNFPVYDIVQSEK